ncbi:MAG: tetratricopeptide repeat protein [Lewinellaceae bacterium]|nr:tetratricopeptide repeat protein [Lewinellaceae bacterium]
MRNTLFALMLLPWGLHAQTEKGITPAAAETAAPTGTTYAVVVGISDYQDPQIPDLRYADKDAEAFAAYLQSTAGGSRDADHLQLLTNQDATAGHIAEALDALLERAKQGDKVVIYFSGHGDVERKTVTQPGFLLAWDAPSRVYMGGGTYSLAFLQEIVTTLSTQNLANVVVITDACHAGKLSGSQIGGAQLTSASLARQYASEVKILSCQPNEFSLEGEQWGGGHGCFSYNLIDGLYGLADRNSDGIVTVGEIDRYLEDHVTAEAAPQSQVPMLLGSKTEKLASVDAKLLANLRQNKSAGLVSFMAVEGRGFEEEVLEKVDSSVRKQFLSFKQAVKDKCFFEPAGNCAEDYYVQLSQNQALSPLWGAMKRSYAAALQDDAQQTMNAWLKSDPSQSLTGGNTNKSGHIPAKVFTERVMAFPRCLERAADLLGKDHYMYAPLQARKHFFEGYLLTNGNRNPDQALGEKALAQFREALRWQPELPAIYWQMSQVFGYQYAQPDSMELYARKAMALHPSWVMPYTSLAFNFSQKYKNFDKAKPYLEQALQMDTSSAYVWNVWGVYHIWNKEYPEAETAFKKAIELDSSFADLHNNLGFVYNNTRRYDEAEQSLLKAIQLDSTNTLPFNTLGFMYNNTKRYPEAEKALKKSIELNPYYTDAINNIGVTYNYTDRPDKAEQAFKQVLQLDSTYTFAFLGLGAIYRKTERYEEAEVCLKKAIQLDSSTWMTYVNLGMVYQKLQRWEDAAVMMQKAVDLGPPIASIRAMLGNMLGHVPDRMEDARVVLNNVIELDPDYPDTYIHLAQLALRKNNLTEAWQYFEKGLEKGLGSGQLWLEDVQADPDFDVMRKDAKWNELLKKYLPDEFKE